LPSGNSEPKSSGKTTSRVDKVKKVSTPLTWETAPDILTIEEAASLVRIPRNAAYEAVRAGFLPAANFGQRRIRVSKAVLQKVFGLNPEERPGTAAFGRLPGGVN
jgi:excisionase family DNA binding protein